MMSTPPSPSPSTSARPPDSDMTGGASSPVPEEAGDPDSVPAPEEVDLTNDGDNNEPPPRKKTKERPKRAPIWKHFTVFVADPSKATCKHCDAKASLILVMDLPHMTSANLRADLICGWLLKQSQKHGLCLMLK